jgi:hypothetical protein
MNTFSRPGRMQTDRSTVGRTWNAVWSGVQVSFWFLYAAALEAECFSLPPMIVMGSRSAVKIT